MTNEELVAKIQNGETEYYDELFERIGRFINFTAKQIWVKYSASIMSAGMDFNDVRQECYLSAYQAVKQYKGRNGASFITFLKFPLRNVPGTFLGKRYKVIGNPDSLNTAVSLDDLFFGDENDTTYLDMLADPMSDSPYEDVLHGMYVKSISNALESALSRLPQKQAAVIRSRYLDKKAIAKRIVDYKHGAGVFDYTKPWEDVISEVGISLEWAYKLHKDAIDNLREDQDLLSQYYNSTVAFEKIKTKNQQRDIEIIKSKILDYFKNHPNGTKKHVAMFLSIPYDTIRKYIKTLVSDGLIRHEGIRNNGYWVVTEMNGAAG